MLRSFQAGRRFQPLRLLLSVSMHCFGKFARRAHISHALRLSASETMIAFRNGFWLRTPCFGSSRRNVHGARSSIPASVFRQGRRGSICIGVHRRLTIRSSRPHVVASAMCFALRSHMSAAPPRGGLTQALGGSNPYAVHRDRLARCSGHFRSAAVFNRYAHWRQCLCIASASSQGALTYLMRCACPLRQR